MKKLRTIYPNGLNERAKKTNLEQPTGKLFLRLSRYGNRCQNLEEIRVNETTKFDTIETLLAHIAIFPQKSRSDNFRRILERMKGKYVRKLASNATNEFKTCDRDVATGGPSPPQTVSVLNIRNVACNRCSETIWTRNFTIFIMYATVFR